MAAPCAETGAGSGLRIGWQTEVLSVPARLAHTAKPILLYLGFIGTGNLLWETAHLPLYTVWFRGSLRDRVVAVLHCWIGDILIAAACLLAALLVVGRGWPARHLKRVALLAFALGVAYAVYSEWVNVVVRHAWAYSSLMPVLPPLGTGLSPLLQWMVIPPLAFLAVSRIASRRRAGSVALILTAANIAPQTAVS